MAPLLVLLVLYFASAPVTALFVNSRWPAATDMDRATYAAMPQLLVSPALAAFYVWLDVRRGYLLENSGEEGMAYGLGITVAVLAGVLLMLLVAGFGRLGAWLALGGQNSGIAGTRTGSDSRHGGEDRTGRFKTLSKGRAAIALSAVGALVVIVAGVVLVVPGMRAGHHCSEAEQQAMFEFPHYGGAEPNWESNEKVVGGCTTSYTVEGTSGEVLEYYRVGLRQHRWVVLEQNAGTALMYLVADRGPLHSKIRVESADSLEPPPDHADLQEKLRDELGCIDCGAPLKLGQTRVAISGGGRP